MMVDSGAAITMITKKWAETHKLRISPSTNVNIKGAAGNNVGIIGTTAFSVQLSPTLEMDLAEVLVSEGDFY
jgi:hypothetical protein